MNIWLINPHDAIPGELWGYKHGMILAETLASRGHEVTYWASNFAHATKQFRCKGWGEMRISHNLRIILVPIISYTKHVSVKRVVSLLIYYCRVWRRSRLESKPDCLIVTMTSPFSDYITVKVSKWHTAALITDFRDLWPEVFATVLPKGLRVLANVILFPFYYSRRYALKNSHAVIAVCQTYLDLARKIAPNLNGKPSAIIYSTGVRLNDFRAMMHNAEHDAEIPAKNEGEVWAIYAGTLGAKYDISTLMEAARILSENPEARNIKIIVAGDGPLGQTLTEFIGQHRLENLVYVGVLDMPRLSRYYAKSDIGLCTYAPDSTVVIPAKTFDYYAAGLPIVNSLRGEFADYLRQEGIGILYEAGDPFSLATALLELASDPQRRETMKRRLQEIAPMFDCDRQYAHIFDLLPPEERRKGEYSQRSV